MKRSLHVIFLAAAVLGGSVCGFAPQHSTLDRRRTFNDQSRIITKRWHWSNSGDSDGDASGAASFDEEARQELAKRLYSLNRQILEKEWELPPNANSAPEEVVQAILKGLWDPPRPDAGFLLLLRTATPSWRRKILKSIGAPAHKENVSWELVSSALGSAMARPRNQYGILVANEEDAEEETTEMPYYLDFPFETLDYCDGNAWIECRMRDKNSHELLVITGWALRQRVTDGAWMVDSITWHDLRDEYRPGVGQTEWMRVCR